MKIGILTFHCAINYGAVLQAYGLQEYLNLLGHEVYVIDYRPDYLTDAYKVFRWSYKNECSWKSNLKNLFREGLVMPIRVIRKFKFQRFVNKHLNLHKWDSTLSTFDTFVFGSDQIWNPCITRGLDKVFIGSFKEAQGKKLIAYAASVGALQNLTSNDYRELKSHLSSFEKVGLREKTLYDLLSVQLDCSAITVDPVLLAGINVFSKITDYVQIKTPYLLLFTLGRDERSVEVAYKIAKQKSLEVIEVLSSKESLYNAKIKQTLSPSEFLGYIKNASYVVTSSFHGTVFSILFQKDFNVITNSLTHGERIVQLLHSLGLQSRIVENDLNKVIEVNEINHFEVSERLAVLTLVSREFISKI